MSDLLGFLLAAALIAGIVTLGRRSARAFTATRPGATATSATTVSICYDDVDLRIAADPAARVDHSPHARAPGTHTQMVSAPSCSRDYDITSTLNERTFEERSLQLDVIGVKQHQDVLRALTTREPDKLFSAVFVPEPNNPRDPKAVAIHADGLGIIGYLSAANAGKYESVARLVSAHGIKATSLGHWFTVDASGGPVVEAWIEVGPAAALARDIREKFGAAPRKRPRAVAQDAEADTWRLGIVGESYRQDALKRLSAGRREQGDEVRFRAELRLEPENVDDPDAVAVHVVGGALIGYVPRDEAAEFNAVLRRQPAPVVCEAFLVGGTPGKPFIGAVLEFGPVKALKRAQH